MGTNVLAAAEIQTATFTGVISGTGSLTVGDVINNGTVVLTGSNTYSGGTSVVAGTLRAGSNTAFGTASGLVTVYPGGVLDLNSFAIQNLNESLLALSVSNDMIRLELHLSSWILNASRGCEHSSICLFKSQKSLQKKEDDLIELVVGKK
jgi:autotransporter-associated beta strand protein